MTLDRAQQAFSYAFQFISQTAHSVGQTLQSVPVPEVAKTMAQALAQKVSDVWQHLLPIINTVVDFAKTNLGAATLLTGGALTAALISKGSNNEITSSTFLLASLVMAAGAGVFLARSGIIPLPMAYAVARI